MASNSGSETVYVLYGSETGNCESIAKHLHHEAVTEKGFPTAECMTLNQAVAKKLLDKQLSPPATADEAPKLCLVIVVSTTGEGEPPENAARFRRWLRNLKDAKLSNVRFTVLALGDTNYNNFCAAGKFIDAKLNEYGARRFYPRGEADDGVGLELVVDPWTEGIWAALAAGSVPVAAPPQRSDAAARPPADPLSAAAEKGTAAATAPVAAELPAVGNATYQPHPERVDMAVAMETAIVYANASQICATLALFMYERIVELGGAATLYPIQYFSPEKVKPQSKIVLFVLCTDSDEHTLCEHCAKLHTREAPLGPFAELLLLRHTFPTPGELSEKTARLVKWMSDPTMRFYDSVCVAPKQESVPQATLLSNRVRSMATACKLDRLSKRLKDADASAVAVSEDDVCGWAETVLDNLPGVTADAATIAALVDWFFDSRVGAAFREAYAAEAGLMAGLEGAAPAQSGDPLGGSLSTSPGCGGGVTGAPSVDSNRSGNNGGAGTGGGVGFARGPASALRSAGRTRRRNRLHYHEQFIRGDGATVGEPTAAADRSVGDDTESTRFAGSTSSTGIRPTAETLRDSKLLNEYLLTPVVFLYSGGAYVSQVAHDMNAGAAAHHLRSSVVDLKNLGHTGFPRRATFVFVVGSTMTKAMHRFFKTLKGMANEVKSISVVKFAILGIDESSERDKSNVCALELETMLLSLKAMKIHCTGLAELESADGLQPVLKAWSTNLWGAILRPSVSVAYLDAASPNVAAGKVTHFAPQPDSPRALLRRTSGAGNGPAVAATDAVASTRDGNGERRTPSSPSLVPTRDDSFAHHVAPRARALPQQSQPGFVTDGTAADVVLDFELSTGTVGAAATSTAVAPLFPWDSVPLNRDNAHETPLVFLYSSSGMAKTVAFHAATSAKELGFPASLHSFSHFDRVDFASTPNVILLCESGVDGQSTGGRRFRRFLLSASHRPDHFSHVRFAVLGLAPAPVGVTHPAFTWANMLSRLQASRVFPVVIMPSLSQLHCLGIPWCECVFATLALTVPPPRKGNVPPSVRAVNGEERLLLGAAAAATGLEPSQRQRKAMSILFLYGSSTGLAEAIAREFHTSALQKSYASRIASLNCYDKMSFLSTDNIVIVCSTAGSNVGGYPDNARRFARYIHRRSQPGNLLKGATTCFAVLGLDNGLGATREANGEIPSSAPGAAGEHGDRDRFCRPAKRLDRRLEELGGRRLCPLGCVDVGLVLAEPVEAWRRQLFDTLHVRASERWEASSLNPPETSRPPHGMGCWGTPNSAGQEAPSDGAVRTTPYPHSHAGAGAIGEDGSDHSLTRERLLGFKIMIAYASAPTSAVPGIAEHLEQTIRENSPGDTTVVRAAMNALTQTEWRSTYDTLVFVVASPGDGEYPLDGSTFLRLLRQKNNPCDLFAGIRYTVLAISDTNEGRFHLGQSLDRRLEVLGGTRFYARGEAVDSFSLNKTVERWISGLLSTLARMHDAARETEIGMIRDGPSGDGGNFAMASGLQNDTGDWVDMGSPLSPDVLPRPQRDTVDTNRARRQSHQRLSSEWDARNRSDVASELLGRGTRSASDTAATGTTNAGGPHSNYHGDGEGRPPTSVVTNAGSVGDCVNSAVSEGILHSWKRLSSHAAEEPVILMNLTVNRENTHWEPGQTVSVMPANEVALVDRILARLKTKPDEPFHPLSVAGHESSSFPTSPLYATVEFPASCSTVLLRYVSLRLTKANRSFFALLERSAARAEDAKQVKTLFETLSSAPNGLSSPASASTRAPPLCLLDVLLAVPHIAVSFRHVVEHLSMLQPRVYSVASSSTATPTMLALCFKVVRHGLCTNWMYDLCQWTTHNALHEQNEPMTAQRRVAVRFTIRPRTDFRMPRDPLIPLIMIGPGTGVSPFRAFLQERAAWLKRRQGNLEEVRNPDKAADGSPSTRPLTTDHAPHGVMDLYFGCRRAGEDYLFADELVDYERGGVLNSLNVAFSREPNEGAFWYGGCYVQDKMVENGVGIAELITQRGARVYVCGDAEAMAKEVHQVLVDIVQQQLCVPKAEAVHYVEGMMSSGRYVRDVWTVSPP